MQKWPNPQNVDGGHNLGGGIKKLQLFCFKEKNFKIFDRPFSIFLFVCRYKFGRGIWQMLTLLWMDPNLLTLGKLSLLVECRDRYEQVRAHSITSTVTIFIIIHQISLVTFMK